MFAEIQLDTTELRPLYDQLADRLRRLILAGRIAPGAKLPSTRRMAREFGISRIVVVSAYEQLKDEGYLDAGTGIGTWVKESLPGHLLRPEKSSPDAVALNDKDAVPGPSSLSKRGEGIHRAAGSVPYYDDCPRPFRTMDPELFPLRQWSRVSGRVWRATGRNFLAYGEPSGYKPLRDSIAQHLMDHRAVRCDPDQIIVTSGSQPAIDLVSRLLLDRNDRVLVEDPGYPGARAALCANGATVTPVPVDGDGLDVHAVETAIGARLLYTTPSHQFPLGVTLSLDRRIELLEWARRTGAWILEDDYDSELRYGSRPLPALQGLDQHGRVVYAGTFSKILAPGLRVGFLVVPDPLVDTFGAAISATIQHPPTALQATLGAFMAEGYLERHIGRVRQIYARRRSALVDALRSKIGRHVNLLPGSAGLHLTVLLDRVDDVQITRQAARCSVVAPALSSHYLGESHRTGLLLGFGACPAESLAVGVDVLARILDIPASHASVS